MGNKIDIDEILNGFHDNIINIWEQGQQNDRDYHDKTDTMVKEAKSALLRVIEERINKVRKQFERDWDTGIKVSSFGAIEELRSNLKELFNV